MKNILNINNLTYQSILNNLNLELMSETFNIIIGANGCGKTTLTNSILDLNKYSGNISLFILRTEIGIVTEKNKLIEGNVIYNLMYPLLNLGYKESEAKKLSHSILKKFQVENLLYRNISDLSKSEEKLLQILISLIHNPKLIIIDDSLDDLQNSLKQKVLQELKRISKSACVLILTSNSNFLNYADNIFVLDQGKIIKKITYEQIKNEEKIFNRINIKIPFLIDLLNKLKFYNIINKDCDNMDEMVLNIWE